jgi:hypothetical protein
MHFVIPGLTRNPVFSWIPAFAGMTPFAAINVAVYIYLFVLSYALCAMLLAIRALDCANNFE